jgi:hypothetical protein
MELSKISSVDLSSIRIKPRRSPLRTKIEALEIGQGFEVTGVERSDISLYVSAMKKEGRSISTKRLGDLHYLVFRYA